MIRRPPRSTLFPSTPLFRSQRERDQPRGGDVQRRQPGIADRPDGPGQVGPPHAQREQADRRDQVERSEEHTSELQSLAYLVCRLLLGKKKHTSELQSLAYIVCPLLLEKNSDSCQMLRGTHPAGPRPTRAYKSDAMNTRRAL